MRKMLMLLAMAAGCAGDDSGKPDPHELVGCNARWGVGGACEAGCLAPMPDAPPANGCTATVAPGQTVGCVVEFLVVEDGVYGCCLPAQVENGQPTYRAYLPCE